MIETVVGDLMTFCKHALDERQIMIEIAAGDKESDGDVFGFGYIQNFGGICFEFVALVHCDIDFFAAGW